MINNRGVIQQWFDEGINDGPRRAVEALRKAFPDFTAAIEDLVAEDDKVAVRWTASGTHKGDFMGIQATGRFVRFSAVYIYRLEQGRIAEVWANPDALGLMKQLEA